MYLYKHSQTHISNHAHICIQRGHPATHIQSNYTLTQILSYVQIDRHPATYIQIKYTLHSLPTYTHYCITILLHTHIYADENTVCSPMRLLNRVEHSLHSEYPRAGSGKGSRRTPPHTGVSTTSAPRLESVVAAFCVHTQGA